MSPTSAEALLHRDFGPTGVMIAVGGRGALAAPAGAIAAAFAVAAGTDTRRLFAGGARDASTDTDED